jgi:ubiquinone/menaquinone biosynthesis C-methylase UbiE
MGLRAAYLKGSVLDLPFAENSFDFIINARLVWTMVEPRKTAAHWVRFLRPGGKLVCFNRFKEGLGMCGGQEVYGQKGMDEAITLAHASSAELVALFQGCGLAEVELRRLPDLTKPECREGLDEWHALMGRKPL